MYGDESLKSVLLFYKKGEGREYHTFGLLWWLSDKESICQCRRLRFDPGSGRFPGEENGNLLQYSCLGNPMDRGTWWATVIGVTKESDKT